MGDRNAAFFASLPRDDLTPLESKLRQVLLDWLHSTPHPFPLIEWIDRRIGGEIGTRRDRNGAYEIYLRGAGTDGGPPPGYRAMDGLGPPRGAPPPGYHPQDAFFASLPVGSFAPPEQALRDAIIDFFAQWKSLDLATVSDLSSDGHVQRRCSFLPQGVSLKDWVQRRIGGEVAIKKNGRGQLVLDLAPHTQQEVVEKHQRMQAYQPPEATPKEAQALTREAFFMDLPADELLPAEHALREALLDWLRNCTRRGGATPMLSDIGQDKAIMHTRSVLLPPKVPLREWIDRRIGGEIELRPVGTNGQFEVHERGGPPRGRAPAGPPRPQAEEEPRGPMKSRGAPREATDFLGTLQGKLSPLESKLRSAVLDFLGRDGPGMRPLLSDALEDPAIKALQAKLLPAGVPLRLWIHHRIGTEVRAWKEKDGDEAFVLISHDEWLEEQQGREDKKEQFFAELPDGEFTPEEEALRGALLDFLDQWKGPEPPTLSNAGGSAEVQRCRAAVLPSSLKVIGVSLKEWITRRIGAEIELGKDSMGQITFSHTGTQMQGSKKRRIA